LAGDYKFFCSTCQHGVEAKDQFELISFCEAFSCAKPIAGRIGLLLEAEGTVIAVDAWRPQFSVPILSDQDQWEIRKRVSPRIQTIASFNNPIDLTGSAVDDDFIEAARFLSKKVEFDCILILLLPYIPGITSDSAARLSQIYWQEGKPIIAYVPHVDKYLMFVEGFQLNKIPVAHSIEEAVHMADELRKNQPC
jgi:acyl-CoA synthetase (NDP forming)